MPTDPYRDANQRNWDDRAVVHGASKFYDLTWYRDDPHHLSREVAFDRAHVGDVTGRRLLHLQCHIGTDSGLDFSQGSIDIARGLFADTATAGTFVQADVYDARDVLDGTFDIVYTGVGALNWLPDLSPWGQVAADLLAPGGVLHVTDFHPMAGTIDDEGDTTTLRVRYPYFRTDAPVRSDYAVTYTDNPVGPIANTETYEWGHGIGELLTAPLDAGLRLSSFTEHRGSHFQALPHMQFDDGLWRLPPEQRDLLPLMFSLSARKD